MAPSGFPNPPVFTTRAEAVGPAGAGVFAGKTFSFTTGLGAGTSSLGVSRFASAGALGNSMEGAALIATIFCTTGGASGALNFTFAGIGGFTRGVGTT